MVDAARLAGGLPIAEVLPGLSAALAEKPNAILVAPPGAGKTSIVPLALLNAPWRDGRRIIVLEPRRLAARAAAGRMATLLDEKAGETVGYRVRFDTRVGPRTVIEVVTDGVFTRMLAEDPGLEDVAAVLFDEIHERSLECDLALALCLDLQSALRPDLRLLPMSATLETDRLAKATGGTVLQSKGRQFAVEIDYVERPRGMDIERFMARVLREEMRKTTKGAVLAFLPGQREIEKVAQLLQDDLPGHVDLHRLYGAVDPRAQDAAIAMAPVGRRKIVLASAIAETSLTIADVDLVVDSGLSRQPMHDPATGLTRLTTMRASKASIEQRAGRAGRVRPGRAIRLWREQQTAALPERPEPEINQADLAPLALTLLDWGIRDPQTLVWLDPPPEPAWKEAMRLLQRLGALDEAGGLTAPGRALQRRPLPPRLAHMVNRAAAAGIAPAERAARLAFLLQERGVGGRSVDLDQRLQELERESSRRAGQIKRQAAVLSARAVEDLSSGDGDRIDNKTGALLALAFPDRIARRGAVNDRGMVRYRLANGSGAEIAAEDALSTHEWLVVADLAGRAGAARILSAATIEKADILTLAKAELVHGSTVLFDREKGTVSELVQVKLGALDLEKPQKKPLSRERRAEVFLTALNEHGLDILPWNEKTHALRQRLGFLNRALGGPWPPMSDEALSQTLDIWLAPFLDQVSTLRELEKSKLADALLWRATEAGAPADPRHMETLAPTHFETPAGSRLAINYDRDAPVLMVRPQELFGLDTHPVVPAGNDPIELHLTSPAGRPIQITRDLPGFWRGSWADVRADLRGRYPKHPWPENPLDAQPTRRTKQRS